MPPQHGMRFVNGMEAAEEIRKLASMVLDRSLVSDANPPESAYQTVRLIETLRQSADQGGKIIAVQA